MTVLSFYSGYLPGEKYGGPVSSLYNFVELVGEDIESYIVCSNHDLNETTPYPDIKEGWNEVGKAKVKYISDNEMDFSHYFEIIKELKPNAIYISSIFSARFNAPIYQVAKKMNIPILLAPRGELNGKALLNGKLKKSAYLLYFKLFLLNKRMCFQATSEDEYKDVLRVLRVSEDRVCMLPNIPSLPSGKDIITKDAGKLRVCFVGRIVQNKNLAVCLAALKNITAEVVFDIYGPQENAQYWDECEKIINTLPENVTVSYCGVLGQLEMRSRYKNYDCFISPTQFENYGQSIVEAMLHDTPVIISKNTTQWDGVEKYKAGFVVPIEDVAGFSKAIATVAQMNAEQYNGLVEHLRNYVADTFDFDNLKQSYINKFENISE